MPSSDIPKLDDSELQSIVHGLVSDAVNYTDGELTEARDTAMQYYRGHGVALPDEGRSTVEMREVADAIRGMEPSILRVIFGPEQVVEFVPSKPEDAAAAKQATKYIQHVFVERNAGFLRVKDVLRDGMVAKLGVFKWGWSDAETTEPFHFTGVTQEELESLAAMEDVTLGRVTPLAPPPAPPAAPQDPSVVGSISPAQPPAPPQTFEVQGSRRTSAPRERVWSLPPGEFLFNRQARDIESALLVGHRTEKTHGELRAMGVSQKDIEAHGGVDDTLVSGREEVQRKAVSGSASTMRDGEAGDANDKVSYYELYVRVDYDGDGIAELRRICAIGAGCHIIENEPADEAPFALYTFDPEPHTLIGGSCADLTMDLQRWKTGVVRATNDSLAAAIFPRIGYVEGQVNPHDILNNAIGAPIRMRAPGMVQPITVPYTGQQAFQMLDYIDAQMERRTGQNAGAAGLDADALQSSSAGAVAAALGASQEQKELTVRLFVEQALKPLFRGLYRMIVAQPPAARKMLLGGRFETVDPATWPADLDLTVRAALGSTAKEQKVTVLDALLAKMESIWGVMGPGNPIFTPAQYANALRDAVELGGFPDTTRYLNDVPADWQPPQQQPQATPEQTLAQAQLQIEQMKTQKDLQIKQAELSLKQQAQSHAQAMAEANAAADQQLRLYAINAQWGAKISQQQFDQDIQTQQAALDGHLQATQQSHDQALAQQQQGHEQQLAAEQQAHEQDLAQQQAAAAPTAGSE